MNQRLTDHELDAALHTESDSILPSSGFADSVMAAVQREASAPPPIPFPWKRAVPGVAAAAVMVVVLIAALISAFRSGRISTAADLHWQTLLALVVRRSGAADTIWILLSILFTLGCLAFFRRLSAR